MADLRMRFTDGSESEFVSILTEKDIENASALEGQKVSSMIEEGKLYYVDYAELLASYNPRLKYAYGQSLLSLVDLDREGQVLPKPLVVLELIEEKADDVRRLCPSLWFSVHLTGGMLTIPNAVGKYHRAHGADVDRAA